MNTTEFNINEIKQANKRLAEAASSIVWLPPQPETVVLEIKLPETYIKQPLIRGSWVASFPNVRMMLLDLHPRCDTCPLALGIDCECTKTLDAQGDGFFCKNTRVLMESDQDTTVPPHRLPYTQTIAVVSGYLVDSEAGELGPGRTISYNPNQVRGFNFWGMLLVSFTPPLKTC